MLTVAISDQRPEIFDLVKRAIESSREIQARCVGPNTPWTEESVGKPSNGHTGNSHRIDTLVYAPRYSDANSRLDIDEARQVLSARPQRQLQHVVLLSSTEIYHPRHSNPGLILETQPTVYRTSSNQCAEDWRRLEMLADDHSQKNDTILTVLRVSPTLVTSAKDHVSRIFSRRAGMPFFGHNPSIQLLAPEDLAQAIVRVVERQPAGVFNVGPRQVIPLRTAMARAKVRRVAVPRIVQRPLRRCFGPTGMTPIDQADFLRYSFTVSNEKIREQVGFVPTKTSAQTLFHYMTRDTAADNNGHRERENEFDDFGFDDNYLRWQGRWLFRFLENIYWRIEARGFEHVPATGGGILVGIHRGFMPFDGVMFTHLLNRYANRVPRFLMHPTLVKFPVLAEFLTKIGGVVASGGNSSVVLERGELLGVFPEGIRGAFCMYKDAYRLKRFGRDDYVKSALRHQVPIIPFVFLGPAESYPILGKLNWKWWKKHTEWPFFPITPTWPWLPLPLPTKWHVRILEPISVTSWSPEDADRPEVVRIIANQVHETIRNTINDMRQKRKSMFWGSLAKD